MIKLVNVSKYYYSSSSITCALRKINLEFNIGEFVAITGESGSGKSTLLNVISGLDSYEEGEMYYYDKKTSYFDETDWEKYRKEEISFIFQNYNLIESFSVLENVMVTYIINGKEYKEAKKLALELLEYVGLKTDYKKKASKLSGGQKQRLAIARALAKNTNIIVADEPTGNLDSENGIAVLKLLKKISKNKLVIVVTHNLEQIEPFITRKIRIFDGEIASDTIIEEAKADELVAKEVEPCKEVKRIFNFSFLNIKSQPHKSFLLFMLVFIATLSSFIFVGNFQTNLDDHHTQKTYSTTFVNLDDTRVLVKKNDDSIVNEQDYNIALTDNVIKYEKYDYVTDVNYYTSNEYTKVFSGGWTDGDPSQFIDTSYIRLDNHSKFMQSYSGFTQEDLIAGRLPTGDNEVILYTQDLSRLNTKETIMLRNDRYMSIDKYYEYEFTIVGILKEKDEHVYFSDNICQIMDYMQYSPEFVINYKEFVKGEWYGKSRTVKDFIVDSSLDETEYDIAFGKSYATIFANCDFDYYENNTYVVSKNDTLVTKKKITIMADSNMASSQIAISKRFFNEMYAPYFDKTQFAIFISDYAYLDETINTLANKGYDTLSCYRASLVGYDNDKVIARYVNLGVSLIALVLVNVVLGLICYSILKVKKNDFIIFKMLGLENKSANRINYFEIITYSIVSNLLLVIIALIIKNTVKIVVVVEMFKYIRFYHYLIVFAVNMILVMALGRKYAKFLSENLKVTMLKEEA